LGIGMRTTYCFDSDSRLLILRILPMKPMNRLGVIAFKIAWCGFLLLLFLMDPVTAPAHDASDGAFIETLQGLGSRERGIILQSIETLGRMGNPAALPALEALENKQLRSDETGRVFIVSEGGSAAKDAITGSPPEGAIEGLYTPSINNQVRRVLKPVIASFRLASPDRTVRLTAARELGERPQEDLADTLRNALAKEADAEVRDTLRLALALTQIDSPDKSCRMEAMKDIGKTGNQDFLAILKKPLQKNEKGEYVETDRQIRNTATEAIRAIERKMAMVGTARNLFYGVSLGSVLLLAALGLAITFGLMGVINMAHGEMLMLGAYSTYATQELFKTHLPGYLEWYLIAAIPVAFSVAGLVGVILERSIIRHLYGRPLETLLATWGISLVLIQTVRLIFGAQNVEVSNPSWLSGGVTVTSGLVLTYNRIAIIFFVIFVVLLVWFLLNRTSIGLKVRAVTQNRSMASSMGVFASRVDMWTFGLGSGIAGLGGLALTQIGNVGPELGQSYIVDSFMVVVLGGVGEIAGTVCGSMGLGIVNKFLEPFSGAVLGKIMVLAFIILFIQKRPRGIFALKGRMAED